MTGASAVTYRACDAGLMSPSATSLGVSASPGACSGAPAMPASAKDAFSGGPTAADEVDGSQQ